MKIEIHHHANMNVFTKFHDSLSGIVLLEFITKNCFTVGLQFFYVHSLWIIQH